MKLISRYILIIFVAITVIPYLITQVDADSLYIHLNKEYSLYVNKDSTFIPSSSEKYKEIIANEVTIDDSDGGKTLRVMFQENENTYPVHQSLPNDVVKAIFGYYVHKQQIEEKHSGRFDCGRYIKFIHGFENNNTEIDPKWWNYQIPIPINPIETPDNYLNTGDSILLGDNGNLSHIALYLGKGRYLSKFGTGPLLVTKWSAINDTYDYKTMIRLVPKLNYSFGRNPPSRIVTVQSACE